MLLTDKIRMKWTGKCSLRCEAGILSDLKFHKPSVQYRRRCSSNTCHVWVSPQHLLSSPIGAPHQACSLQIQSGILLFKLLRPWHPSIHILFCVNNKTVEDMQNRLCEHPCGFVEKKENKIVSETAKIENMLGLMYTS